MGNPMKKNFSLHAPRKADARVLDSIKHEVRKYVKRDRKKPLPEGAAEWKFECRVGSDQSTAETVPLKEISSALDRVAAGGVDSVYIEILSVPAARRER
jgi:hypothetical protein